MHAAPPQSPQQEQGPLDPPPDVVPAEGMAPADRGGGGSRGGPPLTRPAPAPRATPAARRAEVVAGAVALVLGGLHLLLRPRTGTDIAAQIARASFAQAHPLTPVDLSWYAGVHPWGYSLLAPYVMAGVGVGLSGLLAAVAAAVLLARLLRDERAPGRGRGARGAVFAVADVVSGRTSFALGAVAALAALVLLPRRVPGDRRRRAVGAAQPGGGGLPRPGRRGARPAPAAGRLEHGLGASVPVALLGWLFPSGGVQPYEAGSAPYAVLAGLVLAVADRARRRCGSAGCSTRWPPGCSCWCRTRSAATSCGSGCCSPDRWCSRPRPTGCGWSAPVTALLVLWQVQPTWADLREPRSPSFVALNRALLDLDVKRVEVVPLRDHGEAAYVAPVVPLARGWSRQVDTDRNPLFYAGPLDAGEYERWLRDNAVDAVALGPSARADGGGRQERALLLVGERARAGAGVVRRLVAGLAVRRRPSRWPGRRSRCSTPTARRCGCAPTGRRRCELRVHWSRWLSVTGPACVERDGDAHPDPVLRTGAGRGRQPARVDAAGPVLSA